jgi:hypothetical protein
MDPITEGGAMNRQAFLEPFNAKAMTYSEVAKTFVPSSKFAQLAGAWNSVLVGPRGGGKTTLLKMLSDEGQEALSKALRNPLGEALGYTGIYVPSDIAWGTMLESIRHSGNDEGTGELFSEAAFVTHVLIAVASSMARHADRRPVRTRTKVSADLDDAVTAPTQAELERLVATIASLWKLTPVSLSVHSLIGALRLRLLDIKRVARLLTWSGTADKGLILTNANYLGQDMLESATQALQAFDAAYYRPDHRWCLLLDEFEVAPMHLQRTVLDAMRASGAQKILLKVALAPCGPDVLYEQHSDSPPTQINDIQQVELWYADKAEAAEFCRHVFLSRTGSYESLRGLEPVDVLGNSAYAVVDDNEVVEQIGLFKAATKSRKAITEQFRSLAGKDASFVEFLVRKTISLDQELAMQPSDPQGNTLRKVAPLVAFRNAYRGKTEGNKRGVRPFNTAYAGWEAISAISEGNPRWLIGLVTRILSEGDRIPVPVPQQTAAVRWNCQRYADMLQSVASQQFRSIKTEAKVFAILTVIGEYFHDRLVKHSFVEDPPMSFIVDDLVPDDVEHALRIAMNHGAIVCFEAAATVGGFRTLRGKRFRLTYLLAPVFKLPMRKSKSVNLSAILSPTTDAMSEPSKAAEIPGPILTLEQKASTAAPNQGELW